MNAQLAKTTAEEARKTSTSQVEGSKVSKKPSKLGFEKNPMRQISVEKVVLSAGGVKDKLAKSKKLFEILTERKPQIIASSKRIPDFGVRPGLEVGTRVTLRGKSAIDMLKRLLSAIENKLKKKQISDNHFSFGIKEYIEIPGMEYQREIGILGFNATVVFSRPGQRSQRKKIKSGRSSKNQMVSAEEIIKFMGESFKTKVE